MSLNLEKVLKELEKYEHPLFDFSAREKGEAVEIILDSRAKDLGLHTYYFEMHPRDLAHPQFVWTFQRQLFDCMHDYLMEMFTRTPQMK
ncbi:MAG: hypothetical protein A3H28_15165 [Acidobacteria bacterium RIFCSPLOWO2_02_FULL_61_28]|nr:MAG: hypothetical protein A3H28_15165 [Acidobacteria bacterium RIFCSPLOWO2_02_FULL_61_28]